MYSFFMFWGNFICHQLSERSFFVGGYKLPLCARCTGMYLGIFSSFAYMFFRKRFSGNKPISPVCGMIILTCMMPLALDGVSSYFFGRHTTNIIRVITGILFGVGIPVLYIMLYNFKPNGVNNRYVIKNNYELLFIILIAASIAFLILLDNYIVWLGLCIVLSTSIFASFLALFLIICRVLSRKKGILK